MTAKSLTWAQQIVWTGQSVLPESPHYNQAYSCDLFGNLDCESFIGAFNQLCAETDALRLVFHETPQGPRQAATGHAVPLNYQHFESREAAQRWMEKQALIPFDLRAQASAFYLLEITSQHHIFFTVQHHLVTDGRSAALLLGGLAERYRILRGNGSVCPPTPAFLDLAEKLAQPKPTTAFDHTAPIPPMPLYGGDPGLGGTEMISVPLDLDAKRAEALGALAQRAGFQSFTSLLTMQNILATLVAAWLARVTAQNEVAFAMPQHNRVGAAQRDVIGLFMEILPISLIVSDDDTFHTLFDRVTQAGRDVMLNGGPGTSRVDLLRNRNVLLNVFSGTPVDFVELEAQSRIVPVRCANPAHDLLFEFEDLDGTGAFNARMVFDAKRFDTSEQSRAAGHFLALFDAFCTDPETPISSVDILGTDEKEALKAFNQNSGVAQPSGTVLERFTAQISDAPAVRLSGASSGLSHRELDLASNRMAHLLRDKGAKPGDHIAIHLPRSLETLVAILAVHKVGAAFVPLEPSLPAQRRDFILKDTCAQIVISNSLPQGVSPSAAQAYPDTELAHAARPENPAYVIYTSGSTGQPKGVVIGHRELLGYCQTCLDSFGMKPGEKYAFFTPFGFDIVMNSIFMPLITGGETIVYPEAASGADLSILDVLAADEVDFAKPTPSHLRLGVLSARKPLENIRVMPHSGEAFPQALAREAIQTLGSNLRIINEYGPTEAVIGAMMHHYEPQNHADGPLVPLGRPLDGMRIYVVSSGLAHQPFNVPGEIAIGGRLSKGYLNRPDLTDARFVNDPHIPGERLYLTGDLGVFAGPGDLRYLGRLDDQIKLNGIRLELGDIEHAIMQIDGVNVAVVSLRTSPSGSPALVAYVEGACDHEAVAAAARTVLPASINLAAVIQLDQTPVSSNGKINRNALPDPTPEEWQTKSTSRAPVGASETALARLMTDILGLQGIGADDDFYDLGGDSLAAVRIANAAQTAGLMLNAIDIFRHRTIANLARNLVTTQSAQPRTRRAFSRVSPALKAQLGQALGHPK